MARPRTRLLLGLGIPVLVLLLLLAAWAIDTSGASGKVPRNVTLASRDVGRFPEDKLAATVRDVAKQYADAKVQIRTPGQNYEAKAANLGLALDENATIQAALDLDDDVSVPSRPFTWLASFASKRKAPLRFTVRDDVLTLGLAGLQGPGVGKQPTEPQVVNTGQGLSVVSGSSGRSIDPGTIKQQLLKRAASGELPIVVDAEVADRPPKVSDDQAKAFADAVNQKTANGLTIKAGTQSITVAADQVRSWLGSEMGPNGLELKLDSTKAIEDLKKALPATTTAKDASFQVDPATQTVSIIPSQDGTKCCATDTPARLLAAINAGSGTAEVALEVDKPKLTTETAQKWGIKEPVGTTTEWKGQPQVKSFTTYYVGGEPRVTNIHHIADAARGTVIPPGGTFSLNDTVGERTLAKGYVEAGAIRNGEHADEVGGGVSQFSTTLFNAAFFAGIDVTSHQAHSIWFDRYPRGREATLGFPAPDQTWKNNTPYGILIWTSYTDTSVTVTLYSTQYVYGEQTSMSESPAGACTVVTVGRTRHYVDGHTDQDSFRAVYRPDYGVKCG